MEMDAKKSFLLCIDDLHSAYRHLQGSDANFFPSYILIFNHFEELFNAKKERFFLSIVFLF